MEHFNMLTREEMKNIKAGADCSGMSDPCDPCGCYVEVTCDDGSKRKCCSTEPNNCSKSEDSVTCGTSGQSCGDPIIN